MTTPAHGAKLPLAAALRHAVWWGLLAGYAELMLLARGKLLTGRFLNQPIETLWLTPLAEASLFVLVVVAGYAPFARRARGPTGGQILGCCAALAGITILFRIGTLHNAAAILIAVGVGSQLGRSGLAGAAWLDRLVRRTLPILLLAVLVTAGVIQGRRVMRERSGLAALPAPRPGAPNVLLIILDTVRALNLSAYGYGRPTTPALERRAAQGVRFGRALSPAPWTLPSHASMFTGLDAHQLRTSWYVPLDETTPTVAEALRDRGWRTGGFVANLDYTSWESGLDRGFLHYEDYPISLAMLAASASVVHAVSGNRALRELLGHHDLLVSKPAPQVSSAFLRWLDRDRGRPFVAFLNYYDAHKPYVPPEPYASLFLRPGIQLQPDLARQGDVKVPWQPDQIEGTIASYDGGIAYLDAELERLFGALERRSLLENTIVIVTSDHGEEFAEHEAIGHGNTLYRPGLHVPLLIWWPNRVPAGLVVETPVSTRDLAATVLDLVGVAVETTFPGRSLARFWQAGADTTPEAIFTQLQRAPRLPPWYPASQGDMISVLSDGLRYIRGGDGAAEVYDFDHDPNERTNLAADRTRVQPIARLRALIDSVVASPR